MVIQISSGYYRNNKDEAEVVGNKWEGLGFDGAVMTERDDPE